MFRERIAVASAEGLVDSVLVVWRRRIEARERIVRDMVAVANWCSVGRRCVLVGLVESGYSAMGLGE